MTQTPPIPSDPLGKITHKTSALMSSNVTINASMSKEKKAKYQQLYMTFKKSLGISSDLKSKEEFDAAFENLISSL